MSTITHRLTSRSLALTLVYLFFFVHFSAIGSCQGHPAGRITGFD
jgi:hypothetical protein